MLTETFYRIDRCFKEYWYDKILDTEVKYISIYMTALSPGLVNVAELNLFNESKPLLLVKWYGELKSQNNKSFFLNTKHQVPMHEIFDAGHWATINQSIQKQTNKGMGDSG